ncbi:hypothetical protein CFOL_v3_14421 [Cephalotus follicularis]|uniref:Uncharacterized protein n=1 Tax=Cephalotus follicularis TaxID=3775 RepID=A0A1Q3BT41_CEPFO|nr:hypothetical protein CFOL_v3_14421 [Cephalotus follicularis]
MRDEEWVKVAMTDDMVVVEMLLQLHRADPPPPPPQPSPPLQLEWSVRQRRSKQVPKKKGEPTRASPTTPLSWSGATSGSGGAADGFEDSSFPAKAMESSRSKIVVTSETPSTKRSRKKKTLGELKEEESLLLKERRDLKNELATFRRTVEKLRTTNESLKRMKLDMLSLQTQKMVTTSVASEETISDQLQQMEVAGDPTSSISAISDACNKLDPSPPTESCNEQEVSCKEPTFLLPDLNLPCGDDSGCGILNGTS